MFHCVPVHYIMCTFHIKVFLRCWGCTDSSISLWEAQNDSMKRMTSRSGSEVDYSPHTVHGLGAVMWRVHDNDWALMSTKTRSVLVPKDKNIKHAHHYAVRVIYQQETRLRSRLRSRKHKQSIELEQSRQGAASAGCYCDRSLLLRFADNCVVEQVWLVLWQALVE